MRLVEQALVRLRHVIGKSRPAAAMRASEHLETAVIGVLPVEAMTTFKPSVLLDPFLRFYHQNLNPGGTGSRFQPRRFEIQLVDQAGGIDEAGTLEQGTQLGNLRSSPEGE